MLKFSTHSAHPDRQTDSCWWVECKYFQWHMNTHFMRSRRFIPLFTLSVCMKRAPPFFPHQMCMVYVRVCHIIHLRFIVLRSINFYESHTVQSRQTAEQTGWFSELPPSNYQQLLQSNHTVCINLHAIAIGNYVSHFDSFFHQTHKVQIIAMDARKNGK